MFKKGEICIVNESGAKYFNSYSKRNGGAKVKGGDKVVCRNDSEHPFCTPVNNITCGDFTDCNNTWSLDASYIQSTGEFMELD